MGEAAATTERATTRTDALFSTLEKGLGSPDQPFTNVHDREEEFAGALDALPCPYPPEPLVRLYERSNALRPCVEAMAINVHAFGHQLVPRIDLDAHDIDEQIAQSIQAERLYDGDDSLADPLPAEVEARKAEVKNGIRVDRMRLTTFLKNCNKRGFTALRMQLQIDLEITGNAYMEVVRDRGGRVSRLNYCPSVNMRLRPLERDPVPVPRRMWTSSIGFAVEEELDKPRGFVQNVNGYRSYFKEFGDTRVVSASTGEPVKPGQMLAANDRPATEILHLSVFSPRTSYGVPRWIGAVFEVLGIEAMSHVNYLGFDNKGIPPMAVTVSGGTLSPGSAALLENYMKVRLKGRANYHSVLLLEALPAAGSNGTGDRVRVALQPLTQPKDAVFLDYADRSEDVIARQWRISPITRGKTKDFNKATAGAAMQKDEEQVFQPARKGFDEEFERVLLDLGIRYVRMESNSPVASDPEALAKVLGELVKNNVLTPNEARRVASKVINTELPEIEADWGKQPIALTLGGIALQEPAANDGELATAAGARMADVGTTLQRVMALRDQLQRAAAAKQMEEVDAARLADTQVVDEEDIEIDGQQVHLMRIPAEEMAKFVTPHGAVAPELDEAA